MAHASFQNADRTRPILITGSHRSGSTWVGRILRVAHGLGYIQEPFKPTIYSGIMPRPFPEWYHYVCVENQADALEIIPRLLRFDFDARAAWSTVGSLRDFVRFCRCRFRQSRLRRECPDLGIDATPLVESQGELAQ